MQLLLSRKETAKQLGCSIKLVDTLIYRGELKAVRLGRLVKIEAASVQKLIEKNRIGEAA